MPQELPSFDLIVATMARTDELGRLFESLEAQSYKRFRVVVVDQNEDARLDDVLGESGLELLHLRSERGLSRARNTALEHVSADLVGFPDDDCVYPPGLLAGIVARFQNDASLGGVTGRAEDADGRSAASWKRDRAILSHDNLWNRAISFTIFLRRTVVERVGRFDDRLGLGSPEPWASGEEIDYLIRAVREGARIEYDPSIVVEHAVGASDSRIGLRDGASVGYLLRKHRYPRRAIARMLIRPVGGIGLSLIRLDTGRAHFQLATLRGRIVGLRKQAK